MVGTILVMVIEIINQLGMIGIQQYIPIITVNIYIYTHSTNISFKYKNDRSKRRLLDQFLVQASGAVGLLTSLIGDTARSHSSRGVGFGM